MNLTALSTAALAIWRISTMQDVTGGWAHERGPVSSGAEIRFYGSAIGTVYSSSEANASHVSWWNTMKYEDTYKQNAEHGVCSRLTAIFSQRQPFLVRSKPLVTLARDVSLSAKKRKRILQRCVIKIHQRARETSGSYIKSACMPRTCLIHVTCNE